jgi:hypothetical protein
MTLTVWTATVRESPRIAEMVQYVLEQGWETSTVQPVATKPFIGSEGGVGVVIHDKMLTQILIQNDNDLAKPC